MDIVLRSIATDKAEGGKAEPAAELAQEPVLGAAEAETCGELSREPGSSVGEPPEGSGNDSRPPVVGPGGAGGGPGVEQGGEGAPAAPAVEGDMTPGNEESGQGVESERPAFEEPEPVTRPAPSSSQEEAAATRRELAANWLDGGRCSPLERPRASDNPILGIPLEQYFTVVGQFADELVRRRSGEGLDGPLTRRCAEAVAILETHGLNGSACLVLLEPLETRCRRAFGAASRVRTRPEITYRFMAGRGGDWTASGCIDV